MMTVLVTGILLCHFSVKTCLKTLGLMAPEDARISENNKESVEH